MLIATRQSTMIRHSSIAVRASSSKMFYVLLRRKSHGMGFNRCSNTRSCSPSGELRLLSTTVVAVSYLHDFSDRFGITARSTRCGDFSPLRVAKLPPIQDSKRCMSSLRAVKNKGSGKKSGSASSGGGRGGGSGSSSETAEPVLTFNRVSKQIPGGRHLFNEASLTFVRGAKVGVLGVNGSGKSTVLKILAGEGELTSSSIL